MQNKDEKGKKTQKARSVLKWYLLIVAIALFQTFMMMYTLITKPSYRESGTAFAILFLFLCLFMLILHVKSAEERDELSKKLDAIQEQFEDTQIIKQTFLKFPDEEKEDQAPHQGDSHNE